MSENENTWPQGWGKFTELIKGDNRVFPEGLPTWAARFRAARAFAGVHFDGLSQESSDAYFVGLKLTLVESALETYEAATGRQVGELKFADPDISFTLWEERNSELGRALAKLTNKHLRANIQEFLDADKDSCQDFDLRVLLRAFRHLTAHGFFNPTSSGLYTSKRFRALLLELADLALATCEKDFQNRLVELYLGAPLDSLATNEEQVGEEAVEIVLDDSASEALSLLFKDAEAQRENEVRQKIDDERDIQRTRNVAGLALFRNRTSGYDFSMVEALPDDPGDKLMSAGALKTDHNVDEMALLFSIVLIPPSDAEDIRQQLKAGNNLEESYLEDVRARSIVFVTLDRFAVKMSEEIATGAFGWPLKRATLDITEVVTGWANLNVPPIGHLESIRVVVDKDLQQESRLWAVAGSTNTFIEISTDEVLTIASADWGPSLRELAAINR